MQNPKARSGSLEVVPQKVSPRQLRPAALGTASKDRSPKVTDRRSPRSPVPERKRPSRISELEYQNSQLEEDLKKLREQLILSESCKKQAQQDAEESKEQLLVLSVKLEDSKQQFLKFSATEEACVTEPQKIAAENDKAWQTINSAVVSSAMNEIQQLKVQLELLANCENAQTQFAESLDLQLLNLKQNLAEPLSLVENMKNKFKDCYESVQAKALVNETLQQLETAKRTVEILRADAAKAVNGHNSTASELDNSRARVNSLEALVRKLVAGLISNKCSHCANLANYGNLKHEAEILKKGEDPNQVEAEIYCLKSEVGQLRSAIETAETKYQEEQILSTVKIRNAYDLIDKIKSDSSQRESELEVELKRKKADIEELKANLMDKETELQGIVEENEKLNLKIHQKSKSSQREHELKMELRRSDECVAQLKANLMDKETTLQSISAENEMLKLEVNNKMAYGGKVREEVASELEAAKAAEREAVMKLGIVMEEAHRSNRKASRVAEQLEVAQAANSEIEAELRRLKVQSDQWRKAAEAAAAMISAGNNGKITERSLSLDNNYNHPSMNKYSTYCEDIDDDYQRKKNGNMLKKIGVLWKKPQK